MKIRRINSTMHGFALPTVLIASVVMLAVLATSVAAVTATRSALQAQFYNQLARDAAESGLAMAKACIAAGTTTWANPLRPGSTCTGLAAQCSAPSCYLVRAGDVRSTFSVGTPAEAGNVDTVAISGTVEQTRTSNGTVWRTYKQTLQQKDVTSSNGPYASNVLWSQISSGGSTTCAISLDGKAYCWGLNTSGQVGDNSTTQRNTAVPVAQGAIPAGLLIRQIAVGGNHACAIASDNKAYCWGLNTNGQLGDNSTTQSLTPVAVAQGAIPAGATIRQITAGASYTCAIASDNKAYCWGLNSNGQLGDASTTQRLTPVAVAQGATPASSTIRQISAGDFHTCAIASDNKGYCWGLNSGGRLGDASTTQRTSPVAVAQGATPASSTMVRISAGGTHSCGIASDNKVYCWGTNSNGQLGDNSTTQRTSPVAVAQGAMPASSLIRHVAAGGNYSCAIAANNLSYCWGNNGNGRLGDSSTTQRLTPVAVTSTAIPSGNVASQIIAGGSSSCVLATNSRAYCWGNNASGQVGDNSITQRTAAVAVTPVDAINTMKTQQITLGSTTACAVATDDKAYCWGNNASGQVGDNSTTNRTTPVAVAAGAIPSASASIRQIAGGVSHTCAIAADYNAYCWGLNDVGQFGNNTTTNSLTPTTVSLGAIPAGSTFLQIAPAQNHTCALASDSKAYCWGNNVLNNLGDSSSTQRLTPVAVAQGAIPVGATVRQIATGFSNGCVIASNNLGYCWGYNLYGQVGDNSTTARNAPVAVALGAMPAGTTLLQIGVGNDFACALASNHKVYCWGRNNYGQLGDNSTTQRNTPVAVALGAMSASETVIQLSVGSNHACVISSSYYGYCWGRNGGNIGDNTTTNRSVPTSVVQGELPSVSVGGKQVAAGFLTTCAILTNLDTYCYGSNTSGTMGDGTTTQRLVPTAVDPFIVYTTTKNTYYF